MAAPVPNNNGFFSNVPAQAPLADGDVLSIKGQQTINVMKKMQSVKSDPKLAEKITQTTEAFNKIQIVVNQPTNTNSHEDLPIGLAFGRR